MLRDYGENSIVASICPKVTTGNENEAAFGYNPALTALGDRLKEALGPHCLPRELPTDEAGGIACVVVQATLASHSCDPATGRRELDSRVAEAVREDLEAMGVCDGNRSALHRV